MIKLENSIIMKEMTKLNVMNIFLLEIIISFGIKDEI